MTALFIGLGIFVVLALVAFSIHQWVALQRTKFVVESLHTRVSSMEVALAGTQKELKKTNELLNKERDEYAQRRKTALALIEKQGLQKAFNDELSQVKKQFDDKLKAAQKEAEEKIDFSVVQYKKTITKKRKIATRKAEKTKPPAPKMWRSIYDESEYPATEN